VNRRGRVVEAGRPTTAVSKGELGGEHNGHSGLVGLDTSRNEWFWVNVKLAQNGCWEWTGHRNWKGYGQVTRGKSKTKVAHRVAWQLLRGPIPDRFQIDHLCKNRACVNPDHLEPVTLVENTRRSTAWQQAGRVNAAKTHCPMGHAYDDANTLILAGGRRDCRTCRRTGERATKRSKIHCPQGHEFTPENTFMESGGRNRRCLTCRRGRDKKRYEAHLALAMSDDGFPVLAVASGPSTPKAPAPVALESPPAPGTTPRRPLTPDSVGGAA
jgi:hypothetical protein